jgi:hypothetical protein
MNYFCHTLLFLYFGINEIGKIALAECVREGNLSRLRP